LYCLWSFRRTWISSSSLMILALLLLLNFVAQNTLADDGPFRGGPPLAGGANFDFHRIHHRPPFNHNAGGRFPDMVRERKRNDEDDCGVPRDPRRVLPRPDDKSSSRERVVIHTKKEIVDNKKAPPATQKPFTTTKPKVSPTQDETGARRLKRHQGEFLLQQEDEKKKEVRDEDRDKSDDTDPWKSNQRGPEDAAQRTPSRDEKHSTAKDTDRDFGGGRRSEEREFLPPDNRKHRLNTPQDSASVKRIFPKKESNNFNDADKLEKVHSKEEKEPQSLPSSDQIESGSSHGNAKKPSREEVEVPPSQPREEQRFPTKDDERSSHQDSFRRDPRERVPQQHRGDREFSDQPKTRPHRPHPSHHEESHENKAAPSSREEGRSRSLQDDNPSHQQQRQNKFMRVEHGPQKDTSLFKEPQKVKTASQAQRDDAGDSEILLKLLKDPNASEKFKNLLKLSLSKDEATETETDNSEDSSVDTHHIKGHSSKAASSNNPTSSVKVSSSSSTQNKCTETCEFFPKLDANGDESCECCSMTHFASCNLDCSRGFKADKQGCPICDCI
jgi:hypothetical protein